MNTMASVPAASAASPKKNVRGVLALIAAWIVVAVVAVFWMNVKSHGGVSRAMSGVVPSLDGTYVLDDPTVGATASMTIRGNVATTDFSTGQSIRAHVERTGNTLRFSDQIDLKDGYLDPSGNQADGTSPVNLGTITDDGQAITIKAGSGEMRFVKQ